MNTLGGTTEDQPDHPGHDIRRAREAAGLSQAELGRRSGLGVRTVRRVEAGQGSPEGRTIAALRRVLGLPVEGAPPDPIAVLRTVDTIDLIAEISRRLMSADDITRRRRNPPELPAHDLEWPRRNEPNTGHAGHGGQ
jgi:transcriptional regulator with XRE-family HTH domain